MSQALLPLIKSSKASSSAYKGNFRVDSHVLENFPKGTTILSAEQFGVSKWTVTARILLQLPSGLKVRYSLKSAPNDHGRTLMKGEFNAMSELYKWAPDFVPMPHSCGKYQATNAETYFFLIEYVDMRACVPDPIRFCERFARLHRESTSPTGQFGFHITTCNGRTPQFAGWEEDWTSFFTKLLQYAIKQDFETNESWEDLVKVEKRLVSGVIPRVLDALVENGRTIRPCLIHGDLWEGNIGTAEDESIYIYDSGAYYAHNEMEVAAWRPYYNRMSNGVYTRTYLEYYEPSEPKGEWNDRNRLYSVYYNMVYSVNALDRGKAVRQLAYNDMLYLVDKYAPFAAGERPAPLKESDMASLPHEMNHTL